MDLTILVGARVGRFTWLAFPVTVEPHDCGDPECQGKPVVSGPPILRAFTERGLKKKILSWYRGKHAEWHAEAQKARSEELGG